MPGLFDMVTRLDDRANIYYGLNTAKRRWDNDKAWQNNAKYNLARYPLIGDYFKYEDYQNYWNDYMSRRGINWSDVKYPTLMSGAGSATPLFTPDVKALTRMYL